MASSTKKIEEALEILIRTRMENEAKVAFNAALAQFNDRMVAALIKSCSGPINVKYDPGSDTYTVQVVMDSKVVATEEFQLAQVRANEAGT